VTVRGYLRVSTADQVANGHGLDAQKTAIKAEADRRGWHTVQWYRDGGESGKDLQRPAMQKLLGQLRRGDHLVVARLDRLSRSLSDFAALMEQAQRQKWNLVALDLAIDLSTPQGELIASIMAAMARWERRIIGQRTAEGLAAAKVKGRLPGRRSRLPRAVQDQIVDRRDSLATLQWIADELNVHRVPTASGRYDWTASMVRSAERSARLERAAEWAQRATFLDDGGSAS
jgi:DNA invertase Pin-like site-specific DNA recombinase